MVIDTKNEGPFQIVKKSFRLAITKTPFQQGQEELQSFLIIVRSGIPLETFKSPSFLTVKSTQSNEEENSY